MLLLLVIAMLLPATVACQKQEDTSIKVALLPIMDALPYYVAQDKGYFAAEGLQVQAIFVKSAQERDTLLQTGQVDGALTDLISVGLFDKDTAKLKVVGTLMHATAKMPQFRILAAPGGHIIGPAAMKGVPVAISQHTIIEYVTDRLLEAKGLTSKDIRITEVTQIPVRFELLMQGKVAAATLPEPLASGAIAKGAKLIVDDSQYPQFSQSVLAVRTESLAAKPHNIAKFMQAWYKASAEINAHPDKYKPLLVKKGRVPGFIEKEYQVPAYPVNLLPTEAEVKDVSAWMLSKKLISQPLDYKVIVATTLKP